jgi:hypothetical protein
VQAQPELVTKDWVHYTLMSTPPMITTPVTTRRCFACCVPVLRPLRRP